MSDADCDAVEFTGRHDWRVDPEQVIRMVTPGGTAPFAEVRVMCASCRDERIMESHRRYLNSPNEPRTWRPYVD